MKKLIFILPIVLAIFTLAKAEAACPSSCVLSWSDNSNNEDTFDIWRNINGGSYAKVATVGPNITTYTAPALPAPGLSPNTYCWQLTASNKYGTSGVSNSACYTVNPTTVVLGSIVGQTQAQADTALKAIGLVVGTVTQQTSETVALGQIISQSPVAGTTVPIGSAVNLVISSGPAGTIPIAPSNAVLK